LQDAATPVLVDAQLVSFSPANTSEFTTESAYSFYGATKNSEKEQPLTTWLRAHNKQRVAIIVDKSPWGESNRIPFAKAASNAGATVVMTEELPFGSDAENMPTALAKAVAAHADVILMTGYEEGVTVLVKRMQEQNVRVPLIIASDLPKSLIKRGLISKQPTDQLYTITTQPSDEFIEKFTAKYGFPPGNYADRAYDGLMLIVEALQKKSDTETLADYLHNKTNYRGYAIRYDFDHIGDIVGGQWIIEQL
jgi:ABC-type branched-subunit amino acid transport system substrate-binding protein